jgi:hypothetical protein
MAVDSERSILATILQYPSLKAANTFSLLDAVMICAFEWQY